MLMGGLSHAADQPPVDSSGGGLHAHTVAKGETLYGIGRTLGVPVAVLQQHNGVTDPTAIKPGMRLTVPGTHTVVLGETLYAIGRRYGVPVNEVLESNGIVDPTTVAVGTLLILPPGARLPSPRVTLTDVAVTARVTTELASAADSSASTTDMSGNEAVTSQAAAANQIAAGTRLWPVAGSRRDLSGKLSGTVIESTEGASIVSVSSGVVRWASVSRGYGRVIFVQNPLGYIFGYLGIADSLVAVGDLVAPGTEIARLGRNPHDNAANLYFLVFKDGNPIDPVEAPRV